MVKNIYMDTQKRKDLNLRLGNLILAIFLATVPTAITYGTLSVHGLNICRNLSSKVSNSREIKKTCDQASWDTTKSYIVLIGFFITLPTWMWFYLSVKRKKESSKKQLVGVYDDKKLEKGNSKILSCFEFFVIFFVFLAFSTSRAFVCLLAVMPIGLNLFMKISFIRKSAENFPGPNNIIEIAEAK